MPPYRLIDARTGIELCEGCTVPFSEPPACIRTVDAGWFSADVKMVRPDGSTFTVQCPVRYLHPSFPFQKIVFLPT